MSKQPLATTKINKSMINHAREIAREIQEISFPSINRSDANVMETCSMKRNADDESSIQSFDSLRNTVSDSDRNRLELRRMAVIVRDSNDAITVQDSSGVVTAWNRGAEKMYGYTEQEALGMSITKIVPPEKLSEYEEFIDRLRRREDVHSFETQRITKDGRTLDVWLTVTALVDDTGTVMAVATTERDISERKKLEAELQNRLEKITLFTSYVSHDLKNAAIGVHGLAKRVFETLEGHFDDKGKLYCHQIVRSSEHILSLLDELNYYLKEKGTPLQIEQVDLKKVLDSVKQEFIEELDSRNITWSAPNDLPKIRIDKLAVFRAFRNLVENALRHGGNNLSEILIGYDETNEYHVLSVNDDGVGPDCRNCNYLFEPFRRGNNMASPGSGLGLAIVKDVAERHGGRAWTDPLPGGGAFYFSVAKKL